MDDNDIVQIVLLVVAVLFWLGQHLLKSAPRIIEWYKKRQAAAEAARQRGALRSTSAERAPSVPAPDPRLEARRALIEQARQLRDETHEQAGALASTPATATLARMLDEVVTRAETLRDSVDRLPAAPSVGADLDRLAEGLARLAALRQALLGLARQRGDRDTARVLWAGDQAVQALFRPLGDWARHREGVTLPPGAPVVYVGEPLPQPALVELGLTPVAVPPTYPTEPYAWAALARGVGRDLLARVPGFQWELYHRLELPGRYAIPFASRGYFGQEEVYHPFGGWLDTLFSDLVSIVLLGPAAVSALAAELARPEEPEHLVAVRVTPEGAHYAAEPPPHLRFMHAVSALRPLGFEAAANRLETQWEAAHGRPGVLYVPTRLEGWLQAPLPPFEAVAGRIAEALLTEPLTALGGYSLATLEGVPFGEAEQSDAEAVADALAAPGTPAASRPGRVRVAGAIIARERSAARAGAAARWLLSSFTPAAGPRRDRRPAPGLRAGRGRHGERHGRRPFTTEELPWLVRDAIVLDGLLERRRPGEPVRPRFAGGDVAARRAGWGG